MSYSLALPPVQSEGGTRSRTVISLGYIFINLSHLGTSKAMIQTEKIMVPSSLVNNSLILPYYQTCDPGNGTTTWGGTISYSLIWDSLGGCEKRITSFLYQTFGVQSSFLWDYLPVRLLFLWPLEADISCKVCIGASASRLS